MTATSAPTRRQRETGVPFLAIPFPAIDPVIVAIGPFAIRWYALAYIAGIVLGWRLVRRLVQRPGWQVTPEAIDDLLFYVTLGIILGGRIGYVLFYQPGHYLSHPLDILAVWRGGMSFHGGLLGVLVGDAACSPAARGSPSSSSPTHWRWRPRSACSSGGSPTSSTPSSGAASPTCPGRWSSRPPDRSRATRASSTRPGSRASSCSP